MSSQNNGPNSSASAGRAGSCRLCGSAIKPGRKFCSHCGAPVNTAGRAQTGFVRQLSICPECGFENHHSDRFCKTCGGLLAGTAEGRLSPEVTGKGAATSRVDERRPDASIRTLPATGVEPSRAPSEPRAVSRAAESVVEPEGAPKPSVETFLPASGPGSTPPSVGAVAPEHAASAAGKAAVFGSSNYAESGRASFLRPRNLGLASVAALLIAGVVLLYSYRPAGSGAKAPSLSSRSLAATHSSSAADVPANAPAPVETNFKPSQATRRPVASARVSQSPSEQSSPREDVKGPDTISSRDGSAKTTFSDLAPSAAAPPQAAPPVPSTADNSTTAPGAVTGVPVSVPAASSQPEPVAPVTVAANLAASMPVPTPPAPAKPAAAAPNVPAAAALATHANLQPLRVGGSVQAGKILSQTPPDYAAAARVAGIQGTVQLEATIGKDGTGREVKLISGNRMLAPAAIYAVQHWRYRPTELNGVPIEVRTDISLDFRIQ